MADMSVVLNKVDEPRFPKSGELMFGIFDIKCGKRKVFKRYIGRVIAVKPCRSPDNNICAVSAKYHIEIDKDDTTILSIEDEADPPEEIHNFDLKKYGEIWYVLKNKSIEPSSPESEKEAPAKKQKQPRVLSNTPDDSTLPSSSTIGPSTSQTTSQVPQEMIDAVKRQLEEEFKAKFDDLQRQNQRKLSEMQNRMISGSLNEVDSMHLHGETTPEAIDKYTKLDASKRSKYLGDGVPGCQVTNQTVRGGKTMCAYYKNPIYTCESKRLVDFHGKTIYISSDAKYVHKHLFSKTKIRKLHATAAVNDARLCGLCTDCKNKWGGLTTYMDIVHSKSERCILCKDRGNSNNNTREMLCSDCDTLKSAGSEKLLRPTFKYLADMCPHYHIEFRNNTFVRGTKTYSMDLYIVGEHDGQKFAVVCEKDENQHKKYPGMDENKKLAYQIAFAIANNENAKILAIRYNPNSEYVEEKYPTSNYTTPERTAILRQWVIWFIRNIHTMRDLTILYMWYDKTRKPKLIANTFEGFNMIYHAPAPSTSDWDWMPDPFEQMRLKESEGSYVIKLAVPIAEAIPYADISTQTVKYPEDVERALVNYKHRTR